MRIYKSIITMYIVGIALLFSGCGVDNPKKTQEESNSIQSPVLSVENIQEPEIIIKLATTKLENSDAYEGLMNFKETVEADSSGSIQIILYPNSQLGNQDTIAEAIDLGTVEMGFLPIESTENIFPKIAVLPSMFWIEDEDQMLRIVNGEYGSSVLQELQEKTGIVCMGQTIEGVRQIWTVDKLSGLSDLQGEVIQVPQLPMVTSIFQSLGASTTFLSFSQAYDGIRAGVITGIELDPESFLDYRLYEVCKYCLLTNHEVTVYSFMIQDRVLQKMTPEQQSIIQNAAYETSVWMNEQHKQRLADVYQELESHGVIMTTPNDRDNAEMIARIEEILLTYLDGYITKEELESLRQY